MIYLTQLIFVKEGKEEVFHQFEDLAIPLMEKYHGEIMFRIRPNAETFLLNHEQRPYGIHLISFRSERDLDMFMQDENRKKVLHLKEESVKSVFSVFMVKGEKMK